MSPCAAALFWDVLNCRLLSDSLQSHVNIWWIVFKKFYRQYLLKYFCNYVHILTRNDFYTSNVPIISPVFIKRNFFYYSKKYGIDHEFVRFSSFEIVFKLGVQWLFETACFWSDNFDKHLIICSGEKQVSRRYANFVIDTSRISDGTIVYSVCY